MDISVTKILNSIKEVFQSSFELEIFSQSITVDIFLILFVLLIVSFFILCYNYLKYYIEMYTSRHQIISNKELLLSVVVVVDEETELEQLKKSIDSFVNQKYNQFEVIVVVDSKIEVHKAYLLEKEKQHSNLRYLSFDTRKSAFISQSKIIRLIGVKAAQYDWVLLTNSRCSANSDVMLQNMVGVVNNDSKIVYGPYELAGKAYTTYQKILNLLYVTKHICSASVGDPFLSPYNNVLVQKEFFLKNVITHNEKNNRFDDLYLNKFATKQNSHVVASNKALVAQESDMYMSWSERLRVMMYSYKWVKKSVKFGIGMERINRSLFFILIVLNLFNERYIAYDIYILAMYLIFEFFYQLRSIQILSSEVKLGYSILMLFVDIYMSFWSYISRLFYSKKLY